MTLAAGLAAPGNGARALDPELVSMIDQVFGRFGHPGSPGAVVLVARRGEAVHWRGFGYTDLTGSEPLGRSTPFRLASVSKQFTTTAIMILAERGLLRYDDPAVGYVPEIARFDPGITIRHLMTHTSGIPDYYETLDERLVQIGSLDDDTLFTKVDAAATFLEWGEPVFAHGERYEYSNPGYELLALIVNRVSGRSFGEFLRENVFEPAGMSTAVVRDRPEVEIPGRAIGYRPTADGSWEERDEHPLNWIVGSGGIYASADDLLSWDRALAAGAIMAPATLQEAWSAEVLNDGTLSHYGFGWELSEDGLIVQHGGTWVGFRTRMAHSRRSGVTAIALSNASARQEVDAVVGAVMDVEG